jgi:hypothetical protein
MRLDTVFSGDGGGIDGRHLFVAHAGIGNHIEQAASATRSVVVETAKRGRAVLLEGSVTVLTKSSDNAPI